MDDFEERDDKYSRRLRKKARRMPKHGKSLARIYRDAIRKRGGQT